MKLPNNGISHVDSWGIVGYEGRLLNAYPFSSRRMARDCRKSLGRGKCIRIVRVRTITVIRTEK